MGNSNKIWGWPHWVMLPFAIVSVLYMTWVLGQVIGAAFSPERSVAAKKSELLSPAELGR